MRNVPSTDIEKEQKESQLVGTERYGHKDRSNIQPR